ncbi:hypothetical protein vseg_003478 [Gypsophila vaccaria]
MSGTQDGGRPTVRKDHHHSDKIKYRPSIHTRRENLKVKFQDIYGFTVEGNVDDVNVLNEVREQLRERERVWWSMDVSKGPNWYLQTKEVSSMSSLKIKPSLRLSSSANSVTLKRMIRKGVPPILRPKIWLALSGADKKKSTVPESYFSDLVKDTEGLATPATK